MAYIKTPWTDRQVQKPMTFTLQNNGDGTTTLIPAEGTVIELGTPLNAANLNNIEEGIYELDTDKASKTIDFLNNKTSFGYQKFPNGLIVQWGQASNPGQNSNQWYTWVCNFPITFPNACLQVVATVDVTTPNVYGKCNIGYLSKAQFNTYCSVEANGQGYIRYIAIGY